MTTLMEQLLTNAASRSGDVMEVLLNASVGLPWR